MTRGWGRDNVVSAGLACLIIGVVLIAVIAVAAPVIAAGEPPVASFTWSPTVPKPGETVTFDASESFDPDGTIVSYDWDFGDGLGAFSRFVSSGKIATHYYTARYWLVKLTVTDGDGMTGTQVQVINVNTDPENIKIGDFENNSYDYWDNKFVDAPDDPWCGPLTPYHGNATQGEWSLMLEPKKQDYWIRAAGLHISTETGPMKDNDDLVYYLLYNIENTVVSVDIDVTLKKDEWSGVTTSKLVNALEMFVIQDDFHSWQEFPAKNKTWNGLADKTLHFTFTIPSQRCPGGPYGGLSYAKLIFIVGYPSGLAKVGNFYFDKIEFRTSPNIPPNTPSVPTGPTFGLRLDPFKYTTSATDPDGDQVLYTLDWGDGTTTYTGTPPKVTVPNADGTGSDKTGTWATSPYWSKVDETAPVDTDYITGSAAGRIVFPFTPFDVLSESTVINKLTIYYRARDSTSGANKIGSALRIGGTYYDTAASQVDPTTTWTTYSYTYSVNPKTGLAWTVADIKGTGPNPLERFGVYSSDASPNVMVSMVYAEVDGYVPSGTPASAFHAWANAGIYSVTAQAMDNRGATSSWSLPLEVEITEFEDFKVRVSPNVGGVVLPTNWMDTVVRTATVTVENAGEILDEVELTCGGDTGVTVEFAPSIGLPPFTSTMTITVYGGVATVGTHPLTITGTNIWTLDTRTYTYTLNILDGEEDGSRYNWETPGDAMGWQCSVGMYAVAQTDTDAKYGAGSLLVSYTTGQNGSVYVNPIYYGDLEDNWDLRDKTLSVWVKFPSAAENFQATMYVKDNDGDFAELPVSERTTFTADKCGKWVRMTWSLPSSLPAPYQHVDLANVAEVGIMGADYWYTGIGKWSGNFWIDAYDWPLGFYINGNDNFIPANGVNGGGDGSEGKPFIIENWVIRASNSNGIHIRNTDKYFIIRNCLVENGRDTWRGTWYGYGYSGICLENVINGRVENNTCRNNKYGIYLSYSNFDNLTNNTCDNNYYGIQLDHSSHNDLIGDNCKNNGSGINMCYSSYNTLTKDNCSNNGTGIYMDCGCNLNTLDNNICKNNGCGIGVRYMSSYNRLTNNNCSNGVGEPGVSAGIGIALCAACNNTIENNTCSNSGYGIGFNSYSRNNELTRNIIENNSIYGIDRDSTSDYNTFTLNRLLNNGYNNAEYYGSGWYNSPPGNACEMRAGGRYNPAPGPSYWDKNGKGNYWSDWQPGMVVSGVTLTTIDGIRVVQPRPISCGNNKDMYPLVI